VIQLSKQKESEKFTSQDDEEEEAQQLRLWSFFDYFGSSFPHELYIMCIFSETMKCSNNSFFKVKKKFVK
jgi:hypothetical protein